LQYYYANRNHNLNDWLLLVVARFRWSAVHTVDTILYRAHIDRLKAEPEAYAVSTVFKTIKTLYYTFNRQNIIVYTECRPYCTPLNDVYMYTPYKYRSEDTALRRHKGRHCRRKCRKDNVGAGPS